MTGRRLHPPEGSDEAPSVSSPLARGATLDLVAGHCRVHTFGSSPKAVKFSLEDLFEGRPTRTAGAKRRGAEAARQPFSAGDVPSA